MKKADELTQQESWENQHDGNFHIGNCLKFQIDLFCCFIRKRIPLPIHDKNENSSRYAMEIKSIYSAKVVQ